MGLEVDAAFIQAEEHRPKTASLLTDGIPLIDLSPIHSPDPNLASLVSEVGRACEEWGFFQVINHGVPTELRRRIETAASQFFGLPLEEKRKVRRDMENPLGYYDTEHTKNVRDWKEVFDFSVSDPLVIPASHEPDDHELKIMKNQWPEYPPEFREALQQYARATEELAFKLLELVCLSLGLPATHLHGYFKDNTNFIRLNHYPPCPCPDLALGVGRHKDAGALTVLSQDDVGGLEVKRKSDGQWIKVKPIPYSYIINVGDIIQVWSNDKYQSPEHRVVVNSERERFSIPLFFNPAHYVIVKPLDMLTKQDHPKYREYNWGKFFTTRKQSNFKKLDVENLQISHFKVQPRMIFSPSSTNTERSSIYLSQEIEVPEILAGLLSSELTFTGWRTLVEEASRTTYMEC